MRTLVQVRARVPAVTATKAVPDIDRWHVIAKASLATGASSDRLAHVPTATADRAPEPQFVDRLARPEALDQLKQMHDFLVTTAQAQHVEDGLVVPCRGAGDAVI